MRTNNELKSSDLIAFLPNGTQKKPEIVKIEYIEEALNEVLKHHDFEDSINAKLKEKGIIIESKITTYDKQAQAKTLYQNWFERGFKCEVMKPVQGILWKAGTVKISLEISYDFHPDDVEEVIEEKVEISSLDDIRQTLSA